MADEAPQLFDSVVPFEEARIGAAAVYCSDGRFGEQFDDFLQQVLQLPRYDRLAIPGGAAALAGHFAAYREGDVFLDQLRFLIEVHDLRRVVLIAHQDCAFYMKRLEVSAIDLAQTQREDLGKAAARVRELSPKLAVEAWFAHRRGEVVSFEQVVG